MAEEPEVILVVHDDDNSTDGEYYYYKTLEDCLEDLNNTPVVYLSQNPEVNLEDCGIKSVFDFIENVAKISCFIYIAETQMYEKREKEWIIDQLHYFVDRYADR